MAYSKNKMQLFGKYFSIIFALAIIIKEYSNIDSEYIAIFLLSVISAYILMKQKIDEWKDDDKKYLANK